MLNAVIENEEVNSNYMNNTLLLTMSLMISTKRSLWNKRVQKTLLGNKEFITIRIFLFFYILQRYILLYEMLYVNNRVI